jgi:hypothetical protein
VDDELSCSDAQFYILIVDALEKTLYFLGVEALVDGLLVGGIILDEP